MKCTLENRQFFAFYVQTNCENLEQQPRRNGKHANVNMYLTSTDIFVWSIFRLGVLPSDKTFCIHLSQSLNELKKKLCISASSQLNVRFPARLRVEMLNLNHFFVRLFDRLSFRILQWCETPCANMRASFITQKSTWNISTQINVLDPILIRCTFTRSVCVCWLFCFAIRIKATQLAFSIDIIFFSLLYGVCCHFSFSQWKCP